VPDTTVTTVERCSGHDGTWGVKTEFYDASMRIGTPVFRQMREAEPDYVSSDCPIAGRAIMQGMDAAASVAGDAVRAHKAHPLTLVRIAYGLERKLA
jgi:Fe-S oxidoreductase